MAIIPSTLFAAQSDQGIDLQNSSLATLIFEIYQHKYSGQLTLTNAKSVQSITFKSGTPLTIHSNLPNDSSASPIEQLKRLLSNRQGHCKFGVLKAAPIGEPIVNFMRAWLDGIDAGYDESRLQKEFLQIQNDSCVRYERDTFYTHEKTLTPEERGIAMISSTSETVAEIFSQSLLAPLAIRQNIAKALLLGIIVLETAPEREDRLLSETLNSEQKQLKIFIEQTLQKAATIGLNYYTLLQVKEDCSRHEIDSQAVAFRNKYPKELLSPLFSKSNQGRPDEFIQLIERMHKTLGDPKTRAEYTAFIHSGKVGRFETQSSTLALEAAVADGQKLLKAKHYPEAFQHFKQAFAQMPKNPRLASFAGYALFLTGNKDKGKELVRVALQNDPNGIDAHLHLAEILMTEGAKSEAQAVLAKLLQLDPKNSVARQLLAQLDPNAGLLIEIDAVHQNLQNFDYYAILDLKHGANRDEVQTAYHQKTKQYHPDRFFTHPDEALKTKARALYKRCVEAYMVLKNPMKRKEYDDQLQKAKLGQEQIRLKDASDVMQKKERTENLIQNAQAKKFYSLAVTSMQAGNFNSAIMNFELALRMEPNHPTIMKRLDEARQKAKI